MADKPAHTTSVIKPTRIIADFGGRRRLFDRRLSYAPIQWAERRSGKDRRSGFDRRKAVNATNESFPERRLVFQI